MGQSYVQSVLTTVTQHHRIRDPRRIVVRYLPFIRSCQAGYTAPARCAELVVMATLQRR